MWWLIVVGAVCILLSLFLLLKPKHRRVPKNASASQTYALERRRNEISTNTVEREAWYEQRGNETFVRIKSNKPMRNIKVYIRTGWDSLFAYKVDDDEE
jgi:hypothetical protein